MKPAAASADNDAFPVQKSPFSTLSLRSFMKYPGFDTLPGTLRL
jgi:hypothetical protein